MKLIWNKQIENHFDLKTQNLSNVHKENMEKLNLKKEKEENILEIKINELDYEKQKADNKNEINKKIKKIQWKKN